MIIKIIRINTINAVNNIKLNIIINNSISIFDNLASTKQYIIKILITDIDNIFKANFLSVTKK